MALPKFVVALRALSDEERKNFEKFVTLFHQPKSETAEILSHVIKNAVELDTDATIEHIKGRKFKGHTNKSFSNYLSALFTLLEEWLIKKSLDEEQQLKDVLLIRAFQNHGLYQIADKYYSKIAAAKDEYYYTLLYKWMAHFEVYFSHNPFKYREGAHAAHGLSNSFREFTYYSANILKAEIINWSTLFPYDPTADLLFLENIAGQTYENSTAVIINEISGLLKNFEFNSFEKILTSYLQNPPGKGSFDEILVTFYLLRLCNIGAKKNDIPQIFDIMHNLYDFAFEREVFNQRGNLSPRTFRNLVNSFADVNSLQFSLEFIEKYSPYVFSNCPKNSKDVCLAMAFLKHDHYDYVILHTSHKVFHDAAEKIQCYSMHLAAWFMNRNSEPDIYQNVLNSFIGYFKRNPDQQSGEIVNSYLQFAMVLKDIDKGMNPINLSKYNNLINRNWVTKILRNNKIEMI